jgi:hypothetical protein
LGHGSVSRPSRENPGNDNCRRLQSLAGIVAEVQAEFLFFAALAEPPALIKDSARAGLRASLRVFSTAALARSSYAGGFDGRADQDESPLSNSA